MIYISGRITGNNHWEEDFQNAEYYLRNRDDVNTVVNPLTISKVLQYKCYKHGDVPTYQLYMLHDISNLIYCDKIYMLRGWWRSKGARLERHIAKVLGIRIIYQKRGDK